jgi:hypothetical protein
MRTLMGETAPAEQLSPTGTSGRSLESRTWSIRGTCTALNDGP